MFTNRTWTQGITLLQTLNILEGYDLAAMGHNSPQAIHVQVEALNWPADREAYVGDPAHVDVPVEGLLSKEYAALRRGLIDPNQAQAVYPPGDPRKMLAVAPDYRPADSADAGARRGRRGRHHVPGHSGRAGEHGLGHAQQFRWPGPGDDSG